MLADRGRARMLAEEVDSARWNKQNFRLILNVDDDNDDGKKE